MFDMIGKCLTFFSLPLSIVTLFVRQVLLILARGFGYFTLFLPGNAVIQLLVLAPAIAIEICSLLVIDYFFIIYLELPLVQPFFHSKVIDTTLFDPPRIIKVFFTHEWNWQLFLFLDPATFIHLLR